MAHELQFFAHRRGSGWRRSDRDMDEKFQGTAGARRALSRREMLRGAATVGGTFLVSLLAGCQGASTATPSAGATATGAAPATGSATAAPAAGGPTAAPSAAGTTT